MKVPSLRLQVFLWRIITAGWTFFLNSGFPFLQEAMTRSPMVADGSLFRRPLMPETEIISRDLAPVLSAQLTTAPTGRPKQTEGVSLRIQTKELKAQMCIPSVILNLVPTAPPRPVSKKTHEILYNTTIP